MVRQVVWSAPVQEAEGGRIAGPGGMGSRWLPVRSGKGLQVAGIAKASEEVSRGFPPLWWRGA